MLPAGMTNASANANTAGYSGTPLPRKLGIKAGARVALVSAPDGFHSTLGELPEGVTVRTRIGAQPLDVIVAFFSRRSTLERRLPALGAALHPAGGLWIAWPKRASGVEDRRDRGRRPHARSRRRTRRQQGCAIDYVWSGCDSSTGFATAPVGATRYRRQSRPNYPQLDRLA